MKRKGLLVVLGIVSLVLAGTLYVSLDDSKQQVHTGQDADIQQQTEPNKPAGIEEP